MASYRTIIQAETGRVLIPRARWCNNFGSKLRGFTFRRTLPGDEGLVLVEKGESRVNTAIHMLFVFCDLGVLWVNSDGVIVDKVLARPWRLSYISQAPAQYVVEGHPELLDRVKIGERVTFR